MFEFVCNARLQNSGWQMDSVLQYILFQKEEHSLLNAFLLTTVLRRSYRFRKEIKEERKRAG